MTRVIAGTTLSLDGFFEDGTGRAGPLYSDFDEHVRSDYMKALQTGTGAVVMGRRTFDGAGDPDSYADDYEFQVPLFVVAHHPLEREPRRNESLSVSFVTDGVVTAVTRAVAAAGDRYVQVVGGAVLIRQLLAAGLVDELWIDVMPVLLGSGRRLFDGLDTDAVVLEKARVLETGPRTTLAFRVVRQPR
jgi:dihydrofolate reductase